MDEVKRYVGIDVAKAQLDVFIRPSGERLSVANDEVGIRRLLGLLGPGDFVILEATGGLEVAVAGALGIGGAAVAVVNPRQVRDFARATGRLAKTDRLDAEVLARFGEMVRPTPRPLPDAQAQAFEALLMRRRQLVEMLTAEKNRRSCAPKVLYRSIDEHIRWLEKRLSGLDEELAAMIRDTPIWRERDELLRSTPGVGTVLSRTLLARLPELGELNRKQIAALRAWRLLTVTAVACAAAAASGEGAPRLGGFCTWRRSQGCAAIRPLEPSICGCAPTASMPNRHLPPACASCWSFSMPCFATKLTGKHLRSLLQSQLFLPLRARYPNTVAARNF
jgi:transposase